MLHSSLLILARLGRQRIGTTIFLFRAAPWWTMPTMREQNNSVCYTASQVERSVFYLNTPLAKRLPARIQTERVIWICPGRQGSLVLLLSNRLPKIPCKKQHLRNHQTLRVASQPLQWLHTFSKDLSCFASLDRVLTAQ